MVILTSRVLHDAERVVFILGLVPLVTLISLLGNGRVVFVVEASCGQKTPSFIFQVL